MKRKNPLLHGESGRTSLKERVVQFSYGQGRKMTGLHNFLSCAFLRVKKGGKEQTWGLELSRDLPHRETSRKKGGCEIREAKGALVTKEVQVTGKIWRS